MLVAGGGIDRQGFAVAVELLPARAGAVGQVGELRRADPPIAAHPKAHDIAAVAEQGEARSEEHTSELQSLMRISYAVLCWKKKTQKPVKQHLGPTELTHRQ